MISITVYSIYVRQIPAVYVVVKGDGGGDGGVGDGCGDDGGVNGCCHRRRFL